ncbi:nucleotide disphospho-sugar-binding domain-containing protein [Actinosynnema pretiosum]|uniref:Glycosyltransferase n=2 Tax=Actinosynnema TaxID=40566 RepID=A0A290Z9E1_9PSEU|nr:nucleotide disphospho-sugar-binding domain-containing protein [Actinosynnema pretiosum]ATE55604.1 hypothetical protein CNX65_21835 [Actinosynnema pretiosum]
MRVLFTPLPVDPGLRGLAPLAWALRAAGHQVRVAVRPSGVGVVTGAGLTAVPVGDRGDAPTPIPAQGGGPDSGDRLLHLDDALLDDLLDFAGTWRPDLLVWDQAVLAGPVVAKLLGVPHVRVPHAVDVVGLHRAGLAPDQPDGLTTRLGAALARRGAVFTEDVAVGNLTADQLPPGTRPPVDLDHLPLRPTPHDGPAELPDDLRERLAGPRAHPAPHDGPFEPPDDPRERLAGPRVRPTPHDGPAELPDNLRERLAGPRPHPAPHDAPARPRVCLALARPDREGGLTPAERATAEVLVRGAARLDVELIALLPTGSPPLPPPATTHPHDHEPPQELLRACAAVVHRGDPATTSAATAAGLPQLVAPGGAWDEPNLAALLADRGVALVLDHTRPTEDAVAEHLLRLLDEPAFTDRAQALRADVLAQPTPHDAVHRLEDLVAERTGRVVPWARGARPGRTAARR